MIDCVVYLILFDGNPKARRFGHVLLSVLFYVRFLVLVKDCQPDYSNRYRKVNTLFSTIKIFASVFSHTHVVLNLFCFVGPVIRLRSVKFT